MEVAETITLERILKPMVEHTVDVSVPQVFDVVVDSVDDPFPQVVKEVVKVVQNSPERIMEHIVFEVLVPQEHSFFVPSMKEEIVAVMQCTQQERMRVPTIMEETVWDRPAFHSGA